MPGSHIDSSSTQPRPDDHHDDGDLEEVALFRHLPSLRGRLPWARVGRWPTPIEPLVGVVDDPARALYVKREDLSHPGYGGNKIRTLEPVLGRVLHQGARELWATGAYGSNHALAAVIHGRAAGLTTGAALFPQPHSDAACANVSALLAARPQLVILPTVVLLPMAMAWLRRRPDSVVMAPGAASPRGALGALSAALELAEQVAAGVCPAPAQVVLAVGSTCTTAGLLAGLHLAAQLGLAFDRVIPRVIAVRVTPWPITSAARIVHLAWRTGRLLARLVPGLRPPSALALHASLGVDGRFLGPGYGHPTAAGARAARAFRAAGGPPIDVVYAAKAGAALLELARAPGPGPVLFWATKSSAPLARAQASERLAAPARLQAWLASCPTS